MSRIALLPLDERPVNTRYPAMLARIAGAEVVLPPESAMGTGREGADRDAVADWLRSEGPRCDGVVASAEFLAFGNLIRSRISHESAVEGISRLAVLEELHRGGAAVSAFGLVTRIPNANDCVEEPEYWGTYGTRLHRLSQGLHRLGVGAGEAQDGETVRRLEGEIPAEHRSDWLTRRLRNHCLDLALLDLVARGSIDLLLLTSDDTSTWGLSTRERAWIEEWAELLNEPLAERLLVHPGADEVGSALVVRMLAAQRGRTARIHVTYAVPEGAEIVAPYEDRPVHRTVEGQIRACGARMVADASDADIFLLVLPPSPRRTEFREDFADAERADREAAYRGAFAALAHRVEAGQPVAIADVAYPNGSDPLAIELLFAPDAPFAPGALAAYGAWNTAGNTLGTTIAQAICVWLGCGDPGARQRFLTHRFLEDWGWQAVARRQVRAANTARWGRHDPDPASENELTETLRDAQARLATALSWLASHRVGDGLRLAEGSVRLPWRRTFEIDFTLE
ncbi:MAG: DUF4127 family protein [Armatimonadota bacterium]